MSQRNTMASASLILGITAMLAGSMIFAAVPLGALSVLCGILSRTEKRFPRKSVIGMIVGIIAAAGSCVLTVQSFQYVLNTPAVREYYGELFDSILDSYGLSDEYNWFRNGDDSSETPDAAPDTETENEEHGSDDSKSNDDYFDSLYDDYFRYFYGADPYHETTPENPSGDTRGGDFV